MKLLELNINKILLLENYKFQNPYNNIDYLNNLAIKQRDQNQKLNLLKLATSGVEKFHSYFHFEQSFFTLQLALEFLKTGDEELAKEQLEMAIFQDHCNEQAINLMSSVQSSNFASNLHVDSVLESSSERSSQNQRNYSRVFSRFQDYVAFATEEKLSDEDASRIEIQGYWAIFEKYKLKSNKNFLQEIIEQIKHNHLLYHQEAAKLYLNRALVFNYLEQKDLAKNDIRKAMYLDSKLGEREYYLRMEDLLKKEKESLHIIKDLGV